LVEKLAMEWVEGLAAALVGPLEGRLEVVSVEGLEEESVEEWAELLEAG
jgi:hypothetical protein